MAYEFTVVDYPKTLVAGLSIQTNLNKASMDCPALWQKFGPQIHSKLSQHVCMASTDTPAYGISKMIDNEFFDYWAAVPVKQEHELPKEFKTMTIPAGKYVKTTVPSLAKLSEAFMAMYTQWPQQQDQYQLDPAGLCFETYDVCWKPEDSLEIYCKVIENQGD